MQKGIPIATPNSCATHLRGNERQAECVSASHNNWCTRTLLNRIITAQWEGDGGCRVGEVRAGTTSPMPDHKGFKLQ